MLMDIVTTAISLTYSSLLLSSPILIFTEIIWSKFPQFSSKNTIHVDDLSRNFALNPKCGLKISAFKRAPVKRLTDRELYYVARYLLLIVSVDDFTTLNHKVGYHKRLKWRLISCSSRLP
jgi:hypothetical protein